MQPTISNQFGRKLLTQLCTLDSWGTMGSLMKGEMPDGTAANVIGTALLNGGEKIWN